MHLPAKRPAYTLHISTWLVFAGIVLAMLLLNYKGATPDELTRYTYGWPLAAYRHWAPPNGGDEALLNKLFDVYKSLGNKFGYTPNRWNNAAVICDAIICFSLAGLIGLAWEFRMRRRMPHNSDSRSRS